MLSRIDGALNLGDYVSFYEASDFVSVLQRIKDAIDRDSANGDPKAATVQYEAFIVGCCKKAEEIDDSGGESF